MQGIVQGVGFRPFVFNLAKRFGLQGWVRNQSDGVELEIAGRTADIESFLDRLPREAPRLARIVRVEVSERPSCPDDGFRIVPSLRQDTRLTLIAPDTCTCGDCLDELFSPGDRRYRYPFINCTNCGPRYTIIRDIPYDRPKTTMAAFVMCEACLKEYRDPGDRRFHAQPNGCWQCGPRVWLETAGGRVAEGDQAVLQTVDALGRGAVVAVKGLGGFHLAVAATAEDAVARLRGRKVREEKPFAVMFSDMEAVERYCRVSEAAREAQLSPERPIVLMERIEPAGGPLIAPSVAPRNRLLGAFLPYTPLHHLLFADAPYQALVMTSGNQSDEPIAFDNDDARERLQDIADFYLFHDRDIHLRCDDSVLRLVGRRARPVRRARGYVPVPVFLAQPVPPVLGVGAELKNTVCLTRRREAFLGQHVGDLENLETFQAFQFTIEHLRRILQIEPECIAHDLHPDYLSTQWALEQRGVPRLEVQHHHAHIAAVMAEHGLSGPVLGVALDGAGYGTDGTVWGGELLRVEGFHCERLAHLKYTGLPGGDRAVKEPWRMALSYLWSLAPGRVEDHYGDFLARWPRLKAANLQHMLERGLNTPLTSSCGRLFDAVAALLGLRGSITYEGQAAIELEQVLESDDGSYQGEVRSEDSGCLILDPLPMVAEVIEDIRKAVTPGIVSARFHNGLVGLILEAVEAAGETGGLHRIALGGGVFQNGYLLHRLEEELLSRGFEVYSPLEAPANDGGIALGQAYTAALWIMAGSP